MRDVAVLMMLAAALIMALRTPWHGIIWLVIFEYLNPHTFCWGFVRSLPVYQTILLIVMIGFLNSKREDRQPIPRDWRIPMFYMLWMFFLLTTFDSEVPRAAWPKLIEVSKIYFPLFLTLVLINSREKLFALLCAMAGSIGLIAVKGGVWAIGTGFAHRVWGPSGTQFGGNNEFAIVNLMMIPLLIMWRRETNSRRLKIALQVAVPLCFAAAISSWSRGAFLTAGVLLLILLWHSQRKWLVVPLMAAGLVVLVQQLPDEYFGRMQTIQTYEEDESASTRIKAWRDGWRYVQSHPLTGAGFEGWRYVTDRDWHSSIVEILAEHGFIALFMWGALLVGTLGSLTRLYKFGKSHKELQWVSNYAFGMRTSLICYSIGTLFLGLAYWSVLYQLVFCAVLLKKFALEHAAQLNSETRQTPYTSNRNLKALNSGLKSTH